MGDYLLSTTKLLAPSEDSTNSTDPIGELVVSTVLLNKPLQLAGKAALYGIGRYGTGQALNWARSRLISNKLNKGIDELSSWLPFALDLDRRKIPYEGKNVLFHNINRDDIVNGVITPAPSRVNLGTGFLWWLKGSPYNEEAVLHFKLLNKDRIVGSGDMDGISIGDYSKLHLVTREVPLTEVQKYSAFTLPKELFYDSWRNITPTTGILKTEYKLSLSDPISEGVHKILLVKSVNSPTLDTNTTAKWRPSTITTKNYTYFDKSGSNDNSAKYHLQRLLHGGFDKVKSLGDVTSNFPIRVYLLPKLKKEAYDEILNRAGDRVSTSEINLVLDDIFYGGTSVDLDGKPLGVILTDSPNVYSNIVSHELDHAIHVPSLYPVGFSKNASAYFLLNNGSELAARGSLIKDYFKITNPNQPITEDMLKYASLNYIKDTGINNNMTEFFSNIVDWKLAAKWLSKYATGISIPALGTTFPSLEKYNKYYNELK